jgi:hypothetical protein
MTLSVISPPSIDALQKVYSITFGTGKQYRLHVEADAPGYSGSDLAGQRVAPEAVRTAGALHAIPDQHQDAPDPGENRQ